RGVGGVVAAILHLFGGGGLGGAAALGLGLHDEDHAEAHDHRGAHEEDDRVARVLILHRGQRSWPESDRAAVGVVPSTWGAARGVASLVRADFTSSSRRSHGRTAAPLRAIST